jgi:hypothetical protein
VKRRPLAFVAGVASHLVADMVPHKDYPAAVEAPLVLGAVALIGVTKGWGSPELAGALGATMPDIENIPALRQPDVEPKFFFPSHRDEMHGPRRESAAPQALLAGACLLALLWPRRVRP